MSKSFTCAAAARGCRRWDRCRRGDRHRQQLRKRSTPANTNGVRWGAKQRHALDGSGKGNYGSGVNCGGPISSGVNCGGGGLIGGPMRQRRQLRRRQGRRGRLFTCAAAARGCRRWDRCRRGDRCRQQLQTQSTPATQTLRQMWASQGQPANQKGVQVEWPGAASTFSRTILDKVGGR